MNENDKEISRNMILIYKMVEEAGFEPANSYEDRFTVCCH